MLSKLYYLKIPTPYVSIVELLEYVVQHLILQKNKIFNFITIKTKIDNVFCPLYTTGMHLFISKNGNIGIAKADAK